MYFFPSLSLSLIIVGGTVSFQSINCSVEWINDVLLLLARESPRKKLLWFAYMEFFFRCQFVLCISSTCCVERYAFIVNGLLALSFFFLYKNVIYFRKHAGRKSFLECVGYLWLVIVINAGFLSFSLKWWITVLLWHEFWPMAAAGLHIQDQGRLFRMSSGVCQTIKVSEFFLYNIYIMYL